MTQPNPVQVVADKGILRAAQAHHITATTCQWRPVGYAIVTGDRYRVRRLGHPMVWASTEREAAAILRGDLPAGAA